MAISLPKTLQTVSYTLYFKNEIVLLSPTLLIVYEQGYQSAGHFTDNFYPIISRQESITDATVIAAYAGSYSSTAGMAAAEAWLIAHVGYYSGGTLV